MITSTDIQFQLIIIEGDIFQNLFAKFQLKQLIMLKHLNLLFRSAKLNKWNHELVNSPVCLYTRLFRVIVWLALSCGLGLVVLSCATFIVVLLVCYFQCCTTFIQRSVNYTDDGNYMIAKTVQLSRKCWRASATDIHVSCPRTQCDEPIWT